MSDNNTWISASVYDYFLDDSYECNTCGMLLSNSQTYEGYGKVYCGTCYQSK
jgi:formylmethanofuran dehydrogenase subunit E